MLDPGGCRCGAVTYKLPHDALSATYACHCLDCQTWSGSAFAEHILLPEDALICDGPTVIYADAKDGIASEQVICEMCHTRLFNRTSAAPGMIVLRAGTLTASDKVAPIAHIWIKRKQPWLTLPSDVPAWEGTPTPQEFGEALQKATAKHNDPLQT